ncbi:MgtC/SapB family protein [Chitinophaga lutea]|uniref:MgtC/SapB family protein n=1 Tax=Chitinophaga lutea TaxID=2488634 RepID=A0A3N4PJ23_9BACT|nr:MgtC/SapB family protein [Chitinophaga lutea]RPE08216.1 MgtC/SapB family protein [Chitinophaga lutea]
MFDEIMLSRLLAAMAAGCLLGFEREMRRKAAGIRTIAIICVSSTLFTIVGSHMPGTTGDRVASNILTGVGFIGAGVIFRGGFTVDGITTAATIWISAAIGMAIGIGAYGLAWGTVIITLLILWGLSFVEDIINRRRDRKYYAIRYQEANLTTETLERLFRDYQLTIKNISTTRCEAGMLEGKYELTGTMEKMDEMNNRLLQDTAIVKFEVELTK